MSLIGNIFVLIVGRLEVGMAIGASAVTSRDYHGEAVHLQETLHLYKQKSNIHIMKIIIK
jgi:hypothetical protein